MGNPTKYRTDTAFSGHSDTVCMASGEKGVRSKLSRQTGALSACRDER